CTGSVLTCFFFHAPAPPEIYTLSLHDALPISGQVAEVVEVVGVDVGHDRDVRAVPQEGAVVLVRLHDEVCTGAVLGVAERTDDLDRKSTRLNSSHVKISYAVFCLKKKRQGRA